jgi:hypothetical protein
MGHVNKIFTEDVIPWPVNLIYSLLPVLLSISFVVLSMGNFEKGEYKYLHK